jgi:hypothetical protein
VRLSGNGKQLNGLRYYGAVPRKGARVQVNYQTGTPYVQTQDVPVVTPAALVIEPPEQKKILPARYVKTYTWSLSAPAVGGVLGLRVKEEQFILRIDTIIIGGTSIAFNIERRSVANTAGLDLVATDIVSSTSGVEETDFAYEAIAADEWLYLDISSKSGNVTQFSATLTTVVKI